MRRIHSGRHKSFYVRLFSHLKSKIKREAEKSRSAFSFSFFLFCSPMVRVYRGNAHKQDYLNTWNGEAYSLIGTSTKRHAQVHAHLQSHQKPRVKKRSTNKRKKQNVAPNRSVGVMESTCGVRASTHCINFGIVDWIWMWVRHRAINRRFFFVVLVLVAVAWHRLFLSLSRDVFCILSIDFGWRTFTSLQRNSDTVCLCTRVSLCAYEFFNVRAFANFCFFFSLLVLRC